VQRSHDQRGVALPSPVAMVSLAAVVVAGVAFVTTSQGDPAGGSDTARPVTAAQAPAPSKTVEQPVLEPKQTKPKKQAEPEPGNKQKQRETKPTIQRGGVYVEVYNNSGITGLAGSTANTIAGAGWQVVGADNWYGTIPASTVYYPERLREHAKLLARDLGISRIMPAISPMRFDRLTVILTADYA
jgi:hypothetical protein